MKHTYLGKVVPILRYSNSQNFIKTEDDRGREEVYKVCRRYCRKQWSDAKKIIENKCAIKLHKVLAQANPSSAKCRFTE